jgi:hypothetical protein
MDADLQDVGLNALEAMEAQDAEQADNTNEDATETTNVEDAGTENNDANTEVEETEGDDTSSDGEGQEETEPEEKVEDKKELSDEEFEEMAKKRGYAKAPNEEQKAQADARANTMEKLLACPKEIEQETWDELPAQNKIIYNALPYITAEGKDGEVLRVKTPDQLPEDFEFANKKAEMKFQNDLQAQEMKATRMSEALNARAQRAQAEYEQRQEAVSVINQIEALQKAGELPTPKAKQGTPEFDNDEAVKLINKVLNYRSSRMAEGLNLPIKDALMLYKSQHPDEFVKKEAKGDVERQNIAKKISGGGKASGTPVNSKEKPHYYRPGMSTEDVIDRIMDDWDN